MKIAKGQKRPRVFVLELHCCFDGEDYLVLDTVIGIFSTAAKAKAYLKKKLDKATPLTKEPPHDPTVVYRGVNMKEGFGYLIVKHTIDGRVYK